MNFSQLDSLTPSEIEKIKRKGCVVIRDVVDDAEARGWKDALEEFIKSNPDVEGKCALALPYPHLVLTPSQRRACGQ